MVDAITVAITYPPMSPLPVWFKIRSAKPLESLLISSTPRFNTTPDAIAVVVGEKYIDSSKYSDTLAQLGIGDQTKIFLYPRYIPEDWRGFESFTVGPSINDDFRGMLADGTFSDVKFVVQGKQILAHKCVLATRCPKFKGMFSQTGFKEGNQSEIVVDTEYVPFAKLMEFIYTDVLPENCDCLFELLALAEEYILPRLKSLCEIRLIKSIDVLNVASILIHAELYSCHVLKKYAMKFIRSSLNVLLCIDQFQNDISQQPSLMLEIMKMSQKRKLGE